MKEISIKLTQYSHGAGCGCKISPKILANILKTDSLNVFDNNLLVGNETADDAAVYDLGNGEAIISTTDFFMPIVDNPFDFGRIASANAISDVYAMGGEPMMSIAILGWPINLIDPSVAQQVLEGSRSICKEAGIVLAGGHSIDSPEPIFGLAVTGKVKIENLKQNSTAKIGDKLFLTKKLGVGILTTAQKKGILKPEHESIAPLQMAQLNKFGAVLGKLKYINALTDVTGFGLLGHLSEMCEGASLSANIKFEKVPKLPFLEEYLALGSYPGGTTRNWESYGHKIQFDNSENIDNQRYILADPQTSGGLLIAVDPAFEQDFQKIAVENGFELVCFGEFIEKAEKAIFVN